MTAITMTVRWVLERQITVEIDDEEFEDALGYPITNRPALRYGDASEFARQINKLEGWQEDIPNELFDVNDWELYSLDAQEAWL